MNGIGRPRPQLECERASVAHQVPITSEQKIRIAAFSATLVNEEGYVTKLGGQENRMTETEWAVNAEISLFALGTTLLRNRWRIARWAMVGAAVAALLGFSKPAIYLASASFVPQGNDPGRSGLASLAGQFGVSLPAGTQSLSPDFYAKLLKSRVLLAPIARDTFAVQEMGQRRVPFLDLFKISDGSPKQREERGMMLLKSMVVVSVVKSSGVVELAVATRWPSVSLAIVTSLVIGVNEYNQRTRQSQAAAERKFVEGRVAVANAELRAAEDRLEGFLRNNRQFASSPELTFQRDRLQRDVSLQQQVFTSLTQSYEEVRIREVRDTPVITMFETPSVRAQPESRGRVSAVLLGILLGGFIGVLVAFTSGMTARRRKGGDVEADEFVGALGEVKGELLEPVRWISKRIRR
jgi:uncharacterized protein involved in exopolysaccharide biosynthesis